MTILTKPTISYEDVKACTLEIAQRHGRDAALSVLRYFGVERAYHLRPDDWAAFLGVAAVILGAPMPALAVPAQEKKEEAISRRVDKWMANLAGIGAIPAKSASDPNAAMIARDGPAKPKADENPIHLPPFPEKKPAPKPALASLTRMTAMSHMLGNGIKD